MIVNDLTKIIQNMLFRNKETKIRSLLFLSCIEHVHDFKMHQVKVGIAMHLGHGSKSRLSISGVRLKKKKKKIPEEIVV